MRRLIKFESNGCVPCFMVGNYLADKGIEVEVINMQDQPDKFAQYGIMSTPVTILLDDNGSEIERVVGFNPPLIDSLIEQL